MELTNILLAIIATLIGGIGWYFRDFHKDVKQLFSDFHRAMEVQASHEARISNLEREYEPLTRTKP